MNIEVSNILEGDRAKEAWLLYDEAFRELNAMTIQRHHMYRSEFGHIMADTRVEKWLAVDDAGHIAGMAVYTNQLTAWPLISPEYFARRWPVHFVEGRIWYCGFVAVPGHDRHAFVQLIEGMYRRAEERQGVISMDICRFNIEAFHLDRAVAQWLNKISGGQVRCEASDAQNFMTYETAPVSEVAA